MVRYQNLMRKPELFRGPLSPGPPRPGPGTMYPPETPSRRPCFEAKDFKMCSRERPQGQGRPLGLHHW